MMPDLGRSMRSARDRPKSFPKTGALLSHLCAEGCRSGARPHTSQRASPLACLRNGVDVYSLQRLMGHADLSVLRRCLAQTEGDLKRAHERGGPVDRLL